MTIRHMMTANFGYAAIEFRGPMSQEEMFRQAQRRSAERDRAVMDMINHPTNPITGAELANLAARYPERYGRYAGLAKTLMGLGR